MTTSTTRDGAVEPLPYLGQPVKVTRVVPTLARDQCHAHVEFETRFADRSSCEAGELSDWEFRTPPYKG